MGKKPIIRLKQVFAGYENKTVLKDVSFELPEKSICLIEGPNGAGKTTLARVLLGLMKCSRGKVQLGFSKPSYVPQKTSLDLQYPLTLSHLINMGKKPSLFFNWKRASISMVNSETEKVISMVGLRGNENLLLSEASGGQLQRALVARSFLLQSDFILLDEPFANLDRKGQQELISLLQKKNAEEGLPICIIDHHNNMESFYSHYLTLENGKVELSRKVKS